MLRYNIKTGVRKIKTKTTTSLSIGILGLAGLGSSLAFIPALTHADSLGINFENPPYNTGSIDGQNGWAGSAGGPINPAIDQAVVNNTGYGYSGLGSQSFRMSNAFTDGAFGDWPFSPSLTNEAGETGAQNGTFSGGSRQPHFEASWDFASTVPGAEQPGLQISASPDRGDGARMSFVRMRDNPTGLSVEFEDYQDVSPLGSLSNPSDGCSGSDDFVLTTIASNLDRTKTHNIRLTMDLLDGPHNDVVKVYVDGVLKHTGTSWEDYYRWCTESGGGVVNDPIADSSRTVDSMIFQARSGGGTASNTIGNGFLFDNLNYSSGPLATQPDKDQCKNNGWKNMSNPSFKNQGDCISWFEHNILGNGTPAIGKPSH